MTVVEIVGQQFIECGGVAAHRGVEARLVRGACAGFIGFGGAVFRQTSGGQTERHNKKGYGVRGAARVHETLARACGNGLL